MKLISLVRLWLIFEIIIYLNIAHGAIIDSDSNAVFTPNSINGWHPYAGRVTANGTLTNAGIYGGDALLPIYGNEDGFIYGDFTGDNATNSTWLVSPGVGLRDVVANHLYGAYLYGDYQQVSYGPKFWVMNPGVEWMTPRWDAHINGYFPTQNQQQSGNRAFADTFGDFGYVNFNGHDEFDTLVTPYAVIGNGVDGDIGASFNWNGLRARASLGGYFYFPSSPMKDINGVTAGFKIPMGKFMAMTVNDSYDNINHNITSLSFSVSLGDEENLYTPDVHNRLLAPDLRHIGVIATGAGTYAQRELENPSAEEEEQTGIWFFEPGSGVAHAASGIVGSSAITCGTKNNPCSGITQQEIDDIAGLDPNAKLYLASGNYENPTVGDGYTLAAGQTMWGRVSGYLSPASGSARPLLEDSIFLTNNNSINDMQILAGSLFNGTNVGVGTLTGVGLSLATEGANAINDTAVTAAGGSSQSAMGIYMNAAAGTLAIEHSTISASSSLFFGQATGIGALGAAPITITDSTIMAAGNSGQLAGGFGINMDVGSVVTISDSTIIASGSPARPTINSSLGTLNLSNTTCYSNGVVGTCTPP